MRKFVGSLTLLSALALNTTVATAETQVDQLQVFVSLKNQELKVYRGGELVASSNISSGKKGHETPTGVFSVLGKSRHHRSNIYRNASMPYMQRLTWSGIALHSSRHVPDYPASHGCIRLPNKFAKQLFSMDTRGMHVVIEQEPQDPRNIRHDFLFQPVKTWETDTSYDPWVNAVIEDQNAGFIESDPRHPARIFITRRTHKDDLFEAQRLLNKLGFEAGIVDGLMGPATWKAIKRFLDANALEADVAVNHSLLEKLYKKADERPPANGQLYVRKHHRTVYSTQVNITDPQTPLGSHLLTVTGFNANKETTRWLGTSLNDRVQKEIHLKNGEKVDETTRRFSISSTLDRIQMSKLDREQVSRFLSPGSSITISDNGMSVETGKKGTDFIVLTKPQKAVGKLALNQQQGS